MKIAKSLIVLIITCSFLGVGASLAMKKDKSQNNLWEEARRYLAKESFIQRGEAPERWESLERLRKSGIRKGMRDWQDSPAQSVPRAVVQEGCSIKLEDTITDVTLVPYTKKVLMSAFNTLHRYDIETKKSDALAFARPIVQLIQSTDGSLCAILLDPIEDEKPLIRFVNSCKSTFELNTEIEAVPYCQTEEYELHPADLSGDARFIGVISSPECATIYNLKTNKPHSTLSKNEQEFPIFRIHFLKTKEHSQDPDTTTKFALQSNLQTTLYAITDEGCSALQKIDLKNCVAKSNYCSRQNVWFFSKYLVVLLGDQLLAFKHNKNSCNKNDLYEFQRLINTIKTQNELVQCRPDDTILIECDRENKKIKIHNLPKKSCNSLTNLSNDRIFMDESDALMMLARKNELILITKPAEKEVRKKNLFDDECAGSNK